MFLPLPSRLSAPRRLAVISAIAAVLASATVAQTVPAGAASAPWHKPTVVLVHGAFADSSSWNDVTRRLLKDGYDVIALANPLRGVAQDAAYVRAQLESIDGPIVLVGHSYGGAVITNAALGDKDVTALVYIAAFAPEQGESAGDLAGKFPGGTLGETLREVPLPDGSVDLYVQQGLFHQQFAADVRDRDAALMAVAQRPVAAAALNAPSPGKPAWASIPSYFLIPTADKNIPLAAQNFMAERAHGTAVVVEGASHAVLVSEPSQTAALIERAAREHH